MDFITVLTSPTLPMAKTWQPDGSITPYSTAKRFKCRSVPLASFNDMADLLKVLHKSSRSCVIRGGFKGEEYAKANDPEHTQGLVMRRLDLFTDTPHRWLLIEVDEYEPLSCDPIEDPEGAIAEYVDTLPAPFHGAQCYWQLSNSAGHPKNAGKLKCHLWYWLTQPYSSEHLKAWAKNINLPADLSVLQPVQINYTAPPVFAEGVADPVPRRAGILPGHDVDLVLPDSFISTPKTTKTERLAATLQSDPVAQRLYDRGLVKSMNKEGALFVECPCSERHTGESGESTTLYYPANTGGYAQGNFKCLHSHCVDEPQSDFTRALGFSPADDFTDVSEMPELAELPEPTEIAKSLKGIDRFMPVPGHLFAVAATVQWIIKKVIPKAQLIILYGATASGKSFVSLDMACAIARGAPWRGRKTLKGRVAYVVAEGVNFFPYRLQAYAKFHDIDIKDIDIHFVKTAPNLMKGDDVRDLIRALKTLGPLVLVVLDTLAQCMAGGNENSSEDMGLAISQAKVIAEVLGCTVLFVHHTGKDDTKGARGHSSLRAAADAELEVARNGDERAISIGKQKDGPDGGDFGFRLEVVPLGHDEDGEVIDSCAVVEGQGTMANIKKRGKNKGANELLLLDAFNALCLSPDQGVTELEVIDKAMELKGIPESQKSRNNMRTNFIRALRALTRDEILLSVDGKLSMFEKEM